MLLGSTSLDFDIRLCTFIATNGRGYHLLKVGSKRRKTRAELDEAAFSALSSKTKEVDLEKKILKMEAELAKANQAAEANKGANDLMNQFASQGLLRQGADGKWEMMPSTEGSDF